MPQDPLVRLMLIFALVCVAAIILIGGSDWGDGRGPAPPDAPPPEPAPAAQPRHEPEVEAALVAGGEVA